MHCEWRFTENAISILHGVNKFSSISLSILFSFGFAISKYLKFSKFNQFCKLNIYFYNISLDLRLKKLTLNG